MIAGSCGNLNALNAYWDTKQTQTMGQSKDVKGIKLDPYWLHLGQKMGHVAVNFPTIFCLPCRLLAFVNREKLRGLSNMASSSSLVKTAATGILQSSVSMANLKEYALFHCVYAVFWCLFLFIFCS